MELEKKKPKKTKKKAECKSIVGASEEKTLQISDHHNKVHAAEFAGSTLDPVASSEIVPSIANEVSKSCDATNAPTDSVQKDNISVCDSKEITSCKGTSNKVEQNDHGSLIVSEPVFSSMVAGSESTATSECTVKVTSTILDNKSRSLNGSISSQCSEIKSVYLDLNFIPNCEKEEITNMQKRMDEYRNFYFNETVHKASESWQDFKMDVMGIEDLSLFDLIKNYQKARKQSSQAHSTIKYLKSKINVEKTALWKDVKKETSLKGTCEDGFNVSYLRSYFVKELNCDKLNEVIKLVKELETVLLSDAFSSYSDELSKLKIEQSMYNAVSYFESDLSSDDSHLGVDKKDILKKYISILFSYQRQSIQDTEFLKVCQQFLATLVSVLLKNGNHSDYVFIIHHIVRCPSGIQFWATKFLQVPGALCTNKNIISCHCVYYILLTLYLIVTAAPDKEKFLSRVRKSAHSDSSSEKFTLIDSDGDEEELFEVVREWTSGDIVSMLKQISISCLYEHILYENENTDASFSSEKLLQLIAFSTTLTEILLTGLDAYNAECYSVVIQCLSELIRDSVHHTSKFIISCLNANSSSRSALQAVFDKYFFHVIFHVFHSKRLEMWSLLPIFPYQCVSKKLLWTILYIFHSTDSAEDTVYETKDVDSELQDLKRFKAFCVKFQKLDKSFQTCVLNTYMCIALCGNCEEELLRFLVHEVFKVVFSENALQHLLDEGTRTIVCFIKKHPRLMSVLLNEIETNTDNTLNLALNMFLELELTEWSPSPKDIRFIRTWLLEHDVSSSKNYLGRKILSKMNWEFSSQDELYLSIDLHREIAVAILEACIKFNRKENEKSGLSQIFQYASIGGYNSKDFDSWSWSTLFSLKLHALNQKNPPWVQIYDGFLDLDFPDPFEEAWLQPLLNGFHNKQPTACYLFLVMTNIGHSVKRLLNEGLECLSVLLDSGQYLAAVHALYYILPFFVKNSDELLCHSKFIQIMSAVITADMTLISISSEALFGVILHKTAAMIKHQILQAGTITVEFAVPLMKLWINILLKVLSFKQSKYNGSPKQVHFLLDIIVRLSCFDSYTRTSIMELLFTLGNPILSGSLSNTHSRTWLSKIFGTDADLCTILKQCIFPDYPWLAWFILKAELQQKQTKDLWLQFQKEMCKDIDHSPSTALKNACNFSGVKLDNLPIYRWALQILKTPLSHPVVPLLWQEFFYCYMERISISGTREEQCPGLNYFRSGKELAMFKKLKIKAEETAEHYRICSQSSHNIAIEIATEATNPAENVVKVADKQMYLKYELWNIFRAFCLWMDNKDLLQPTVCFSALEPKYCCEKLKQIISQDRDDWIELICIDQVKDDLNQKVNNWQNDFFITNRNVEICHSASVELDPVLQLIGSKDEKTLPSNIGLRPPLVETEDIEISSWNVFVQLIEGHQRVIFKTAKKFTELESKLKRLNYNYEDLIPQEFENENFVEEHEKSCRKGTKCVGPAKFKVQLQRTKENQRIKEKLDKNQEDRGIVQEQLLNLPVYDLCQASVSIENYIEALSRKMENTKGEESLKFNELGVSLFYHQIKTVDKDMASVKNFSPSRNFFSISIESLGNIFIRDQESQLCPLVEAILKYPRAGELAFVLFNPNNASVGNFLTVYEKIISSVKENSSDAILVLLNKVNLNLMLKEKCAEFADRRKLFRCICKALFDCGPDPSQELVKVHEILRKHFRTTLSFAFPEFYEDCIDFILEGMETNKLDSTVWNEIIKCFGCSIGEDPSQMDIATALRKFADNLLLSPEQQIFVTSQPLNIQEVRITLNQLQQKFMDERLHKRNIYQAYEKHLKPFGVFLSVLIHCMLSSLNEINNETTISKLWDSIHKPFFAWIYPVKKHGSLIFPWSESEKEGADLMLKLFSICLNNFHEKLLEYNSTNSILSQFWISYVDAYVKPGVRHFSLSLCHLQFVNLPWTQFYPDSEDLEGMCVVLQSDLKECKEFLAKISVQIPWIQILKHISETKSPEYVRKTLITLGKLLIISEFDASITKRNQLLNNLKAIEELPWYLFNVSDAEELLQLYYYYLSSNSNILQNEQQHSTQDSNILQFIKLVCCMGGSCDTLNSQHSNEKRVIFLHNYMKNLAGGLFTKTVKVDSIKNILPSLFTDIEKIIAAAIRPEEQMRCALPLVKEVILCLNNLTDTDVIDTLISSFLTWLKLNPKSPVLLPLLNTSSRYLDRMLSMVEIAECCILTRFNTELHDPAEANGIWNLLLHSFQLQSSMTDEFIHACINKKTFLTLYCYVTERMQTLEDTEATKLLLSSLIGWLKKCEIKEYCEPKLLLIWDKVLELSTSLAEDNLQIVAKRALVEFCSHISLLAEDRSSDGILGAIGLGRLSSLSVNFRFLCRILSAFVLIQIPSNALIRLQPMAPGVPCLTEQKDVQNAKLCAKLGRPAPSPEALLAVENLKLLLTNKPYSALRDLTNSAIEFTLDPRHCLLESRQFLRDNALHVFPKQFYLYALC